MRRYIQIVVLGLGITTMAGAILATVTLSNAPVHISVMTVMVRLGNLTPEVTLTGWYHAPLPVNLDAGASGSLQLDITGVGDKVDAGELLGKINSPELLATLNQANSQLNQATAATAAAKADVAVQVAIDQQSVAQAQRSVTAAQSTLTSAQSQESNAASVLSAAESQGAPSPLANSSIEIATLSQQLASAQANVASAQVGLQSANQILSAAQATMNSDPAVTALQAKVSESNAAVSASNAAVQQAKDAIASANIISPISGLVSQILVASGSSVQSGSPVIGLSSTSGAAYDVQLFIPQSMGSKVAVGDIVQSAGLQAAVIKYVSGSLTSYQGGEGFLATATVVTGKNAIQGRSSNVGTPEVPLQFKVNGKALRHVAVVPLTAISDISGKPTLTLRSGRNAKDLPVKVIAKSNGYVAVSGVRPGSTIEVKPS